VDDEVLEPGRVLCERELGLGRADEADRDADDARRPPGPLLDELEQPEERRRRVADDDEPALQPVAPELERGRRARRGELLGERRDARVGERADDVVAGGQAGNAARAIGAKAGEAAMSVVRSTIPQAWIIRTTVRSSTGCRPSRSASSRIVANERR
jgi:hypothetical protein